jgi:5-methylcytosine-specific restriction endonuclease McrA
MTKNDLSLAHLSNHAVIAEVARLTAMERQATAHLVAALAELDARRLYLGEGCSSLFTYCTSVLHLSEHAAYSRIEAARAGRRYPVILELLIQGRLNVTTVGLLAGVLTGENHRDLLAEAAHKSKREVEVLVARIRPLPDVPAAVRKVSVRDTLEARAVSILSAPAPQQSPSVVRPEPAPFQPQAATTRPVVAPLAPDRYKVQFTVGRETYDKLRRAQDLMRHAVPNGDPAVVFDRALTVLLTDLEKAKVASTSRPGHRRPSTAGSRYIPAEVKRAVWKRDGGQCAFKGRRGRCTETGFLEFHHLRPFAVGGIAEEANIELRCAAHNQYEADLFVGPQEPLIARERPDVTYGVNSVRTELGAARL